MKTFLLQLFLISLSIGCANLCLLCPLRIPNRPRPLDQFRLPSVAKIIETSEAVEQLCRDGANSSHDISPSCQADVSHLFCSLTELIGYYRGECPGSEDIGACQQCQRQSAAKYRENSWILTWIDSVGKMPSGISDGNYHWLGDYEQCLELREEALFNGSYCLLRFQVTDVVPNGHGCVTDSGHALDPLEVNLGICKRSLRAFCTKGLPSGCNDFEMRSLAQHVADHEITVNCQLKDSLSWKALIFLSLTTIWLLVIAFATVHYWFHGERRPRNRIDSIAHLLCVQRNLRLSLRTSQPVHTSAVSTNSHANRVIDKHVANNGAIAGIEVVSTVMLILGNLLYLIMPYLENVGSFYRLAETGLAQPIVNTTYHADALLALMGLKLAKKARTLGSKANVMRLAARYAIRAWPVYAWIVGFTTLLYVYIGEGPMWSYNDLPDRCSASWLSNILFINNLLGYSQTCLDGGHLWALAAQFLLLALILLYWQESRRRRDTADFPIRYGLTLRLALLLSLLHAFIVSYVGGAVPTLLPTSEHFSSHNPRRRELYSSYVNWLYLNPVSRLAPFAMGLLACDCGAALQKLHSLTVPIWVTVALYVVWGPHLLAQYESLLHHSELPSALYAATHRLAWGLAVLLLVSHLDVNHNNALNSILSWRAFRPISKLAFMVYLISEPVALSLFSSLHRPIYATPLSTILTGVGTLVCSCFIAIAFDTLISRPISSLFQMFRGRGA